LLLLGWGVLIEWGRTFGYAAVADPSARAGLVLVEAHALRGGRGEELHWDIYQSKAEVAGPHCLRH
jgi:hypothetical protein